MAGFLSEFFPTFNELLKSEFNRGYVAAVAVMLAISLVLLVLRIVLAIIFRVRRCRHVMVERRDGDIVISADAVENAVKQSTAAVPGLAIEQVKILSSRKRYWIDIFCSYDGSEGSLPAMTAALRERLLKLFSEFFGVGNIAKINFRLRKLAVPHGAFAAAPPKVTLPKIEPATVDTIEVKPAPGPVPLAGDDEKLR